MIIIVNPQPPCSSGEEHGASVETSQILSGDTGEEYQMDWWKYLDLSALGNGPRSKYH